MTLGIRLETIRIAENKKVLKTWSHWRRMIERKSLKWVLLIFVLAFLTLYSFSGYILDFQNADAAIYGDVARNIVERNSMESRFIWAPWSTWLRLGTIPPSFGWKDAPLLVSTLALFFWIFGSSFWTMKLVGVMFGSLLVIPTFYLTKTIFGKEKAIVASLIVFMYPFLILGSIVQSEKVFSSFWILCAIYFLSSSFTIRNTLMSGFFCGLTFLARFDLGGALFLSAFIFYFFGVGLRGESVKRRLLTSGVFVAVFLGTILLWLVHNFVAFGYFTTVTGIVARTFTHSEVFYISPLFFFLALGVFFVVGALLALSTPIVARFTSKYFRANKKLGILLAAVAAIVISITFFVRDWLIFLISVIFTYPQMIYQSSPIIFALAGIGIVRSIRKVGMVHPIFTFPLFTILSYSALPVNLGATYTIPYLPLIIIFAASAIFDISSVLSGNAVIGGLIKRSRSASHWRLVLTAKHLTATFLLGCILLSFLPQYAIIMQAPKVQNGPFLNSNWDKAVNWILANTDENETILARFPVVTFYTQRRTIQLEPFNITQLLTIIHAARISYLVIDDAAYWESLGDAVVSSLYKGELKFPGIQMVYEVEDPRLAIFDVKEAPSQVFGWFDEFKSTEGWSPDERLVFKSDGDFLEIAGNSSAGDVNFFAGKYFSNPIPLGDDPPFVSIRYRLKDWARPGYPPPAYLTVFITNSAGKDYASDWIYPANGQDYDWHTMMWRPPEKTDVVKLGLVIRIREAGGKLSVIIDYVAVSGPPVYPT